MYVCPYIWILFSRISKLTQHQSFFYFPNPRQFITLNADKNRIFVF